MNKSIMLAGLLGLAIAGGFQRIAATPAAKADAAADRVVAVIHVDVIPPFTDKGRTLLRKYVDETRKDDGAYRIELFEDLARPNHATLVEIWDTQKTYDDHLGLDHTRRFRTDLQPMLGSPFDERLHRSSP
jgi:quinol monooxygenase YgiN